MINFVVPYHESGAYRRVIDVYIEAIVDDSIQYIISKETVDSMVNVHFFLEPDVLAVVGKRGLNVFICHGIADKGYRDYESVDWFDFVFVSGPWWVDKLTNQGMDKRKIKIGGYSRLDKIYNLNESKEILKDTVLWLPTHNFSNVTKDTISSYPKFEDYIETLSGLWRVSTSTHPANNEENKPTGEELLRAKVVIADCGSSLYEALALDIPVVYPDFLVKRGVLKHYGHTLEGRIYRESIGYHIQSPEHLVSGISRAIERGVDLGSRRLIESVFPRTIRGRSGGLVRQQLKELSSYV